MQLFLDGGNAMQGGDQAAPPCSWEETKATHGPPPPPTSFPAVGRSNPQPKHSLDIHCPALAGSLLYELKRTKGRVLARPWAQ